MKRTQTFQIEQAAFVTKVVATKKKIPKTPQAILQHENDKKKIQFKPVLGARPVSVGPTESKVIFLNVIYLSTFFKILDVFWVRLRWSELIIKVLAISSLPYFSCYGRHRLASSKNHFFILSNERW